jgi:dGTPase
VFLKNEEAILQGNYQISLLDKCKYEAQINDIIKISVSKVYKSKEVIEKEVSGYAILADLLDVFITAINNVYENKASNYDKLLMHLLPAKYAILDDSVYNRILSICNFIAGMSDGAAILLHKKIKGIEL